MKNWSFQCDNSETGRVYSNENFIRGRKSLCIAMSSKNTKTKSSIAAKTANPVATTACTASRNFSITRESESIEIISSPPTSTDLPNALLTRKHERLTFGNNKESESRSNVAILPATSAASLGSLLRRACNDVVPVGRQKIPWGSASIPLSTDLFTALRNKRKIADYTGEAVQKRDSDITNCLRRPKDRRSSSSTSLINALRKKSTDTTSTSFTSTRQVQQSTFAFDAAIESRLQRSIAQSPSSSGAVLNCTKLSSSYDVGFGQLCHHNGSTLTKHFNNPPCDPSVSSDASDLLNMIAILEAKRNRRFEHSSRCDVDAGNIHHNYINALASHIKPSGSSSPNPSKPSNVLDNMTVDLDEKRKLRIEHQAILHRLAFEREQKTLQLLLAERERKSALLLKQQKAALIATEERDETVGALLALRAQRRSSIMY